MHAHMKVDMHAYDLGLCMLFLLLHVARFLLQAWSGPHFFLTTFYVACSFAGMVWPHPYGYTTDVAAVLGAGRTQPSGTSAMPGVDKCGVCTLHSCGSCAGCWVQGAGCRQPSRCVTSSYSFPALTG